MQAFELATADVVMIVLYVLVIIGIGFWVSRGEEETEDYFLAGRALAWPLVGFSLFASNISSSTLVGLAGSAYATGIAVYSYEWMAALVLVFFVIFILPLYLRTRIFTMPEYLERRFDQRSRYYFSGITVFNAIIIDMAGALYAGALVVRLVYPETPLWVSVWVIALIAGVYTIFGGLKAVVYTDTIQAILLLMGSTVIAWLAFEAVGSWDAVTSTTPDEMLRLYQPADSDVLPWPGLFTGLILLGFYYWCTNQTIVQRVLGARSIDHGRHGALFAGLLKVPVLFIMILPGTFARVLYPELPNPDLVFPTLTFDLLPAGVRGLILVAFVAAIMSSVDSVINSASTLVTMDFVQKLRPQTSSRKLVVVGRITAATIVVLAALVAPQIIKFPSLWDYLQAVLAYTVPPIVGLFLVGIFWKRANGTGAFTALMVGLAVAVALLLWQPGWHFLYVAVLLFVLTVFVQVVVSLMTPAPAPEEVEAYMWHRSTFRQETRELAGVPWYKNYRWQSVALVLITLAVVAWWW